MNFGLNHIHEIYLQHHDVIQFVLRRPPNSFSYRFFYTYTSTDTLTLASTCTMYNILNAKYLMSIWRCEMKWRVPFGGRVMCLLQVLLFVFVFVGIELNWQCVNCALCPFARSVTDCAHTVTFVFMHHLVRCFRMINMAFTLAFTNSSVGKYKSWSILKIRVNIHAMNFNCPLLE